jgi:hypothetical protein
MAYAVAFAFLSWALAVTQVESSQSSVRLLAYALNLPVAIVGRLLPIDSLQGLDLFFRQPSDSGFGEFARWDESMWQHVGAATLTYLFLFSLPALVRFLFSVVRKKGN